jgi:hypothetical protein
VGNELNGQFQRTVTGSTNGTLIETGTDNGFEFELPGFVSTGYAISESGNLVDGSLSLSEAGTDRYGLLEQFNNTSNALASNGPGNVDYSPTGAPLSIGQGPAAPTSGASYPGEQSPAAAEQDPFAQQGLSLLHEYCFAAGTLVLTKSGPKPIEQIEPGELVLSVDDRNPDGPAEWKPVEQVYHNAPAELLNVHLRATTGAGFPPFIRGGQGGRSERLLTRRPGSTGTTCRVRWIPSSARPSITRFTSSAKAGPPPPDCSPATASARQRAVESPSPICWPMATSR